MTARPKKEDIDFEIKFYEGVLKKKGDFFQALVALGDLYTKKGMIKKGLEVDKKLSEIKPEDPLILYNLACSYSLTEDIDNSYEAIKKAFKCGYQDFRYLEADKDMINLLKDPRFKKYLTRVKKGQYKKK